MNRTHRSSGLVSYSSFQNDEAPRSKVSSWSDATIRDYVCRSRHSVSLIFVYRTESQPGAPSLPRTNPPALLTHRETSPSPNQCGVFFSSVLKFGLECFVQWDASSELSDGRELQPLSPRSKVLLMMKERKRARDTNFSETRPHIKREKKVFQTKEKASAMTENKTTTCSVNYECFE